MRSIYLFTLIFIITINNLNAQSDFKPGYVILNTNDTLFGKIDSRGDNTMSHACRFKSKNIESLKTYGPNDIREYRFLDGKIYVSKTLESGKSIFLEYLIKGKLNVFYYRDDDGKDYNLIEKNDLPLKVILFKEEIRIEENGTPMLYQSKSHIGLLKLYTNDVDDFKSKPINIIKPDNNNLIKFARDYHNAGCKNEKCIIYQKNIFLKASFELIYDQSFIHKKYSDIFVNTAEFNSDFNTPEFGLNMYLSMPKISERFYFKTGIKFGELNFNEEKLKYKIIPTQIQYQYPHYKLVPKLFFGFNNYFFKDKSFFWTIAPGAGIDYRFLNNFSVTSSFTAEFLPVTLNLLTSDPESIKCLSHSLQIGLKIDL